MCPNRNPDLKSTFFDYESDYEQDYDKKIKEKHHENLNRRQSRS